MNQLQLEKCGQHEALLALWPGWLAVTSSATLATLQLTSDSLRANQ